MGKTGKKIVVKELGAEAMLYDAAKDELHVLNATARLIHRLAEEGRGLDEIEAAIRAGFQVPPDRDLRAEIERCLATLRDKGL